MTATKPQITCDGPGCGKDITYTGNCMNYRIVLGCESMAHYPDAGAVTAMHIEPTFKERLHFCCKKCLRAWIISDRRQELAYQRHLKAHRREISPGMYVYDVGAFGSPTKIGH